MKKTTVTKLKNLPLGAQAVITKPVIPKYAEKTLSSLGFTAGAHVMILKRAPFSDTVIVSADGCRVALRLADCGETETRIEG